jgi:UDP-N-acetyl-D-glucosamine dehydrogenase
MSEAFERTEGFEAATSISMTVADQLINRLGDHSAVIGVLGMGYAGLPLACRFAEAGFATVGLDIDAIKIRALAAGKSYIGHIPAEQIARLVTAGKLQPSDDMARVRDCDVAIMCVPTPLGEGSAPNLEYVTATAKAVRQHLHRGLLIVLESTTYPGTTEEVVLPLFGDCGLKLGVDFFMAYSPEREDPGNANFCTQTIPKIVGGVTPVCLKVACKAYGQVVDKVVPVSSARVAEAAKLLENIYRCVNIAMINELKLLFERMEIDAWEVINAAATKPFGFTPFYPGPGLGGHCIPIDPFYLTWKARQYNFSTRFIQLAGEINTAMPSHIVEQVAHGLNRKGKALNGAKILILGVAYKRDIEDIRESPALSIIRILEEKLAVVRYHDPHVPVLRSRYLEREMRSVELTREAIDSADAAVVVTDHSDVDYGFVLRHAQLVIDTRNVTAPYRKAGDPVLLA